MLQSNLALAHRPLFGGQLIAKALGGVVTQNQVNEIGWNRVTSEDHAVSHRWLGDDFVDRGDFTTFQWHGETFTSPPGATRILTGDACEHCIEKRIILQHGS